VELTYMEAPDKKRMAGKILGAYESAHLEMLDFIDKFPDLPETPAQFQERCAQVALKCFWRELGHDPQPQRAATSREESRGPFSDLVTRLMHQGPNGQN
jgi:hypothetical protein